MPGEIKLFHVTAQITSPNEKSLTKGCDQFFGKVILAIAKKLDLNILKVEDHFFEPHGYTVFALLSESHMSFHTWPEKDLIAFDLFTCRGVDPEEVKPVLLAELGALSQDITINLLDRTVK